MNMYSPQIKEALSLLTQKPCHPSISSSQRKMSEKEPQSSLLPYPNTQAIPSLQPIFNPKYTFDHFVVGAGNSICECCLFSRS